MTAPKKIYVKTFGCQMNVYDSERMTELLAPMGFAETTAIEDADVVLLNTCHIREKAVEKVYSDLGRIRDVKDQRRAAGKDTIVTVAGCVAQAEGAEIARREPSVDLVVGPQSYHRLGELIARADSRGRRRSSRPSFPSRVKFAVAARARTGASGDAPFSPCRKAATGSAPSASCPTRAARNSRAPSRTWRPRRAGWWPSACARSRCSARTSTPTTGWAPTAGHGRWRG